MIEPAGALGSSVRRFYIRLGFLLLDKSFVLNLI
jgi:hypothetical protein